MHHNTDQAIRLMEVKISIILMNSFLKIRIPIMTTFNLLKLEMFKFYFMLLKDEFIALFFLNSNSIFNL